MSEALEALSALEAGHDQRRQKEKGEGRPVLARAKVRGDQERYETDRTECCIVVVCRRKEESKSEKC